MVLRRCRRLLKDEDAALDALHDIFAKLVAKNLARLEFPSSFLYTTATRHCLDKLRGGQAQREVKGDDLLENLVASGNLEASVSAGRILDWIFRRDESGTRVMATLFYLDGLSLEEVGEQMGLSTSAVRKRLQRLKSQSAVLAERSRSDNVLRGYGKEGTA